MEAIITETTCGENCWTAREDVCRCQCGGKNHGIQRDDEDGSEQPTRTRRVKGKIYELHSVVEGYHDANQIEHKIWQRVRRHVSHPWNCVIRQRAPKAKFGKWPELDAYEYASGIFSAPYLIWLREDAAQRLREQEQDESRD